MTEETFIRNDECPLFGLPRKPRPARPALAEPPRKINRRVGPGVTPWASHRSGRAQLRHPVRPVRVSPSRCAIRGRYVNPEPGSKAPVGWPTHDSLTDILLPSPRSPRYRFPSFDGPMKICDSLRPSHRASLPSLGD